MHDDVNAEVERALANGRRERVVANDACPVLMCHRGDERQVGYAEQRIGRSLNPYHPCLRSEHLLDGSWVGEVYKVDRYAARADELAELLQRAVVGRKRRDNAITRTQQLEQRHICREARRKGYGCDTALKCRDAGFERSAVRRALAPVTIAAWITAVGVSLKSRREIDGLGDRSGRRIGSVRGVHAECVEAPRWPRGAWPICTGGGAR